MKNKLLLAFLFNIILFGSVFAAVFLFNTFNFTFDISEPLSIEYAVAPSKFDECSAIGSVQFTPVNDSIFVLPTVFPGETTKLCFKFNSESSAALLINMSLEGDWDSLLEDVVQSPAIVSPLPGEDRYMHVIYKVKDNVNGTFDGTINFGRGNP